jgi:hypothetical protein
VTITRPSASGRTDHEKWEDQRLREIEAGLRGDAPKSKFSGDRDMHGSVDSRLTTILKGCGIVLCTLTAAAIVASVSTFISLDRNVAILLSRPEPVSKEQYANDMALLRTEQANMRSQLETIRNTQQAIVSGK